MGVEYILDAFPRYYYHSQTHETRWEPPSGGFLSIKEQRELRGEKEEVVEAGSDEEEENSEEERKWAVIVQV